MERLIDTLAFSLNLNDWKNMTAYLHKYYTCELSSKYQRQYFE